MIDFDATQFKQVKEHCKHLEEAHLLRNEMFDEMVKMFMLSWNEGKQMKNDQRDLFVTISPSARNQLLGAVRLMVATDPTFSVEDVGQAAGRSSKLERVADTLFRMAGRLSGDPIHYEMILSGLLFSEVHVGLTRTSDLTMAAQGASPVALRRLKEAEMMSPYMIETWDPREGFPEFDRLGMRAFYRKTSATTQEIMERYGDDAKEMLGSENKYKEQTVNIYYDLDRVWVWLDSMQDRLISGDEHGMDFVPVSASIIEGSQMFSKQEDKRQPFLYTMWKSKIWNRQNLMLTVMYDLVFKLGVSPQFVFEGGPEDRLPEIDWTMSKAGIVRTYKGQRFDALKLNVLDPSLMQGWQLADDLGVESTIYKQALGQALTGSNATFSLQSLLSQAGRLPLVRPQKKLSWQIADVAKMMLRWTREEGTGASYEAALQEIKSKEIPEYFNIECQLQIDMPQDLTQMANLALALTTGDVPLTSKEYARENFLRIGDSSQMNRDIMGEKFLDAYFTAEVRKIFDKQAMETEMARTGMSQDMMQQQPAMQQEQRPPIQQQDPIMQQLMAMGAPQQVLDAIAQGQLDPRQALMMMQQQMQGGPGMSGPPGMGGPGIPGQEGPPPEGML